MRACSTFFREGGPMARVTYVHPLTQPDLPLVLTCVITSGMVNATLEQFPGIRNRYMQAADYMKRQYGIAPMYGLYWNFCLNWGRGSQFVKCLPHVDAMNIAIGLCSIFIFGEPPRTVCCMTFSFVAHQASSIRQRSAGCAFGMPKYLSNCHLVSCSPIHPPCSIISTTVACFTLPSSFIDVLS